VYNLKSDGQPVNLDWVEPNGDDNLPLILLIPGVLGLTEDHYDLCELIYKIKRYQLVIFNRRGHGQKLVTPRFATAGDMTDFNEVLHYVKQCKPNAKIFGVAFSAGTANLYRYVGESGENCVLEGGCCISSGYDTDFCISNVPSFVGGLILGKMKEFWLRPNEKVLRERNPEGYEILSRASNVWEFHRELYRFNQPHPLQLKKSDEEEEVKASSLKRQRLEEADTKEAGNEQAEYLKRLNPIATGDNSRRPMLFVHALDDPIFPKSTLEYAKARLLQNPFNLLVEMKTGYHVCFFEGFFTPTRWTNRLTIEYFDALLSMTKQHS